MANVDIDEATEEMIQKIDGHDAASGDVPRETSIEYYKILAEHCRDRASLIQSELDDEEE